MRQRTPHGRLWCILQGWPVLSFMHTPQHLRWTARVEETRHQTRSPIRCLSNSHQGFCKGQGPDQLWLVTFHFFLNNPLGYLDSNSSEQGGQKGSQWSSQIAVGQHMSMRNQVIIHFLEHFSFTRGIHHMIWFISTTARMGNSVKVQVHVWMVLSKGYY